MNKVILTGRICRDVEVKQTPNGKSVVSNCIAVKREFKNTNGEYESDFINFQAWGTQAEYLGRYARKGDRAEICGRWQVRKGTMADGSERTFNECIADTISVYSAKSNERGEANAPSAEMPAMTEWQEDGDLPF